MSSALGYVRVSTEEQTREGVSLDAQEERLRAYCSMTGLELVDCYREEGVSGSVPLSERPAGKRLVAVVHKQRVDVVALKLDRLFRDASDALTQTRAWDRAGVALHLVDMGGSTLNTASAMGRLFLTMTAAFAELERNLISERTAAALGYKRERREAYGPTPLGYAREGSALRADSEELELVARIQTMRADGLSLRAIAGALNAEGVETGRQVARFDRAIRPWQSPVRDDMSENPQEPGRPKSLWREIAEALLALALVGGLIAGVLWWLSWSSEDNNPCKGLSGLAAEYCADQNFTPP